MNEAARCLGAFTLGGFSDFSDHCVILIGDAEKVNKAILTRCLAGIAGLDAPQARFLLKLGPGSSAECKVRKPGAYPCVERARRAYLYLSQAMVVIGVRTRALLQPEIHRAGRRARVDLAGELDEAGCDVEFARLLSEFQLQSTNVSSLHRFTAWPLHQSSANSDDVGNVSQLAWRCERAIGIDVKLRRESTLVLALTADDQATIAHHLEFSEPRAGHSGRASAL